jgi:hypothetical protein
MPANESIKHLLATIRLAIAVLLLGAGTGAMATAPLWSVSHASGIVRIAERGKVRPAVPGTVLAPGAIIATGAASRAVIVRGEEFVVMSPRTQLRLPALEQRGIIQIIADFGAALFKVERKSSPHFGVRTPHLAAVVKGTTFRVAIDSEKESVGVSHGAVQVSTRGGKPQMVEAGMKAEVPVRAPNTVLLAPNSVNTEAPSVEAALLDQAVTAEGLEPDGEGDGTWSKGGLSWKTFLSMLAILLGGAASLFLLVTAIRQLPAGWPSGASFAGMRGRGRRPVEEASPARVDRVASQREVAPTPAVPVVPAPVPATARPEAERVEARMEEPAPPPEEDENCRRASKRARVLLSATVATADGELAGRLRDISRTGAVIEAAFAPPIGTVVLFRSGSIDVEAEILWSRDGRFGIRFAEPLSETDLPVQSGG